MIMLPYTNIYAQQHKTQESHWHVRHLQSEDCQWNQDCFWFFSDDVLRAVDLPLNDTAAKCKDCDFVDILTVLMKQGESYSTMKTAGILCILLLRTKGMYFAGNVKVHTFEFLTRQYTTVLVQTYTSRDVTIHLTRNSIRFTILISRFDSRFFFLQNEI